MYQRVSVIGVGIITVKQACQNLSLAAPLVFLATSRHWFSKHLSFFIKTAGIFKNGRFSLALLHRPIRLL